MSQQKNYNKGNSLRFGGIFSKCERASDMFKPTRCSAIALICLDCPLPAKECKPSNCKRYNAEIKKLEGKKQ